jgi:PAS domain S-box-containing protein
MIRLRTTAAAAVLACGVCARTDAADPPQLAHLNFRRIMPEDGLPAARVNRIFQDSRRFMWFATAEGLARYDGHEFRVYRHASGGPDDLAWRAVFDIAEDASGDLWLATDRGVAVWQRATERFVHYRWVLPNAASLSSEGVRAVLVTRDGTLWVGTVGNGLNTLDRSTGRFERVATGGDPASGRGSDNGHDAVLALHEDHRGNIWIGTAGGAIRLDPRTRNVRAYRHDPSDPRSLSHDRVTSIDVDAEGKIWLGTNAGLCRLDPESGQIWRLPLDSRDPGGLQSPIVNAVVADRGGRVWVGTDGGGLSRLDPGARTFAHLRSAWFDARSLASDVVLSLYEDRDGDLWVGTYPAGVNFANRQTAAAFQTHLALPGVPHALSNGAVWAFEEEPGGDIWVGTDGGGLNRLDRATNRWSASRHDPDDARSLGSDSVTSLCRDSRGQLWVGTYGGGLNLRDPRTGGFRRYLPEPGRPRSLSSDRVWRIVEDAEQRLWVATRGGGVDRYDPSVDGFVHYRHDPANPRSLTHDNVLALLATRSGGLWAGTYSGVARWDAATDSWQRFESGNGPGLLAHETVNDLCEDRRGSVWIATEGGGLNRYDPATGTLERHRATDGLPSNTVRSVVEDDDGALWVSTNQGIARFDPRGRRFRVFDQSDGISGTLFHRGARLRTRGGQILFGGAQGFTELAPGRIESGLVRPNVVLTRFEVFNQEMLPMAPGSPLERSISETRQMAIPARLSVISFQFSAMGFRSPHRVRYEYRLDGFDAAWRAAGPERRATYTNLDPGRYQLRVRATGNEGVVSEDGVALEIVVVPPFWRTWWFRSILFALLVVGLVATGWGVSERRLRSKLHEAERERQIALERQRVDEAVRQRERAYRQIFNSTQDAILLQDAATGAILDANEAAVRIFGWPKEELLLRTVEDLSEGGEHDSQPVAAERMRQALGSGSVAFEWRSRRANGELFPTEVQLSRSEIGGENRVLAVVRDITERKRMEEERLRLERQLLQAQKLESLGVLAGGIAHDFNNLLVAILGHSDLALRDLAPAAPARESLGEIEKAARRAADLSRQMLAYSGRGQFAVEEIRLRELVLEMVHLLKSGISKKAALRLDLDRTAPVVRGDATQIRQIVMNLVINASEAIGEREGSIVLATGSGSFSPEELAGIPVGEPAQGGGYVWLEVSDTGCGMDDETQRRVFEPFFTTKFTGRGLGLSAVLGIVRGHKGALRLRSELGKGTAFRVYFPVAQSDAEPSPAGRAEPEEWVGSGTVLLVDDEEIVRELGQEMLARLGFRVVTASDGREATEVYRELRGEIVLVLLDLTMPRMSGEETFHALRAIDPEVRIVLSSGYSETDVASRFSGTDLAGFVQKPYSLADLALRLRAAMGAADRGKAGERSPASHG